MPSKTQLRSRLAETWVSIRESDVAVLTYRHSSPLWMIKVDHVTIRWRQYDRCAVYDWHSDWYRTANIRKLTVGVLSSVVVCRNTRGKKKQQHGNKNKHAQSSEPDKCGFKWHFFRHKPTSHSTCNSAACRGLDETTSQSRSASLPHACRPQPSSLPSGRGTSTWSLLGTMS
jgi:hypothetical protein